MFTLLKTLSVVPMYQLPTLKGGGGGLIPSYYVYEPARRRGDGDPLHPRVPTVPVTARGFYSGRRAGRGRL